MSTEHGTIQKHHAYHKSLYHPIREDMWAGVRVSAWLADPENPHCAMRVIEGHDPSDVRNRVAYIEKTPRVRVNDKLQGDDEWQDGYASSDWRNWVEGPKGCGGEGGDDPANELYGHYPPSREWCDEMLRQLGAVLL